MTSRSLRLRLQSQALQVLARLPASLDGCVRVQVEDAGVQVLLIAGPSGCTAPAELGGAGHLVGSTFFSAIERAIVQAVGDAKEMLQGIAARIDVIHGAALKLKLANLVDRGVLKSVSAQGYGLTDLRFLELARQQPEAP